MGKIDGALIRAAYDAEGVYVYQAFEPRIASRAIALGTFGEGFGLSRMTWIKPSLGWMMHRSGYAEKRNQERVLRIKVSHPGFEALLSQAALSSYHPEVHASVEDWKQSLEQFTCRVQWDPDRDLGLDVIEGHRTIQIGISAELIKSYVNNWILGMQDVTDVVRGLKLAAAHRNPGEKLEHPFPEKVYEVEAQVANRLGIAAEGIYLPPSQKKRLA
jgi:hypothetical protein